MSGHIFELNDAVDRKQVVYKNRYGLDITGELYFSKKLDLFFLLPATEESTEMPKERKGLCNFFGETGKRIFCCYGIIRLNKYKLFSHQNANI